MLNSSKTLNLAMDLTGAGDNPAFIKIFHKLAERLGEGSPVAGSTAKPKPGSAARPCIRSSDSTVQDKIHGYSWRNRANFATGEAMEDNYKIAPSLNWLSSKQTKSSKT